jgi:hypothetical protein
MTFIPCSRWIYVAVFRIPSGFAVICPLAQTAPPHIHFLYIGSGLCLFLPPDSGSLRRPLDLASGSQNQGPQGTCTPKFIAHAGRTKKNPATRKGSRVLNFILKDGSPF